MTSMPDNTRPDRRWLTVWDCLVMVPRCGWDDLVTFRCRLFVKILYCSQLPRQEKACSVVVFLTRTKKCESIQWSLSPSGRPFVCPRKKTLTACKLWGVAVNVTLLEINLFIQFLVILILFQGHRGVKQFRPKAKFLDNVLCLITFELTNSMILPLYRTDDII